MTRRFRDPAPELPDGFPVHPGRAVLVGLDGLDAQEREEPEPARRRRPPRRLRLSAEAARRIRSEIERAGGREVCFLAEVDEQRHVHAPRAVSRGNFDAVLVAARDAGEGGVMIHNHPSGVLEPSDADMRVAAQLYDQGLGSAIVDNEAGRLYVVVEPPEPRERILLDVEEMDALLGPDGPLADIHDGYEDRPGQRAMVRAVAERFNEGGVAVVEAGTGTGKSLAYLLPAARWAQENDERTVVSTNTINLQEQLAGKDLPLVRRVLGEEIRWALVKGRGNYVSIRRAHLAAESQGSLFEEDRSDEVRALLEWIGNTADGSLSDLTFDPSEELWEEVQSDPDICLRARCPHFQECFYQRARRNAASAQLLVVNHHLLFTDLAVRRATQNYTQAAVLPPYKRLVLDEAHNVEDAATQHLGAEVTRRGLYRALSRLDRRGRGILTSVHEAVGGSDEAGTLRERIENRVRPALSRARAVVEGFVETLEAFVGPEETTARLGPTGIGEPAEREEVGERLSALISTLGTLEREVSELRARLELDEKLSDALEGRLLDLRSVERRLGAMAAGVRLVLAPGEEGPAYVRWLESRGRGRRANLALSAAPIELGPVLRESLFTRTPTTVLTSATLATRRSFAFLRSRLGLSESDLQALDEPLALDERIVPSPFDYATQTVLAVPTDLPPAEAGQDAFQEATARVVADVAELSDGGLFVLFTSHAALRRVADHLRAAGLDGRWPLFVHGEGDRHRLLRGFVEAERGILLGTASFWEGVDVPGDPLRGLILQKLPFRVPTEPITAARMEAIERAGGSAFQHFMLPHAALRLKQGFGRLVRARTDRGAVLVLDDRLVTRRYGRYLRDSLPDAPLVKGPWQEVMRRLRTFYGEDEPTLGRAGVTR
ncbi:MAG: helicase C-terminal domain-containing protein [Gemmatimonadota bacterium]|jgi:ATP-dependent DNA helicase DinG